MGSKYDFTGETMRYEGRLLHRIRRIEDGKLGGWIESEENLSQEGNCWVDGEAYVYDDARVYGNAQVFGDAIVRGNARVYGNAKVYGHAEVYWNAQVYGNAEIYDYAEVYQGAEVKGNAEVYDYAKVYGDEVVCDDYIGGDTEVCDGYENYIDEDEDEDTSSNEQLAKVVQDFIYKIDDSNKFNVKTEYNSIDEYFSSSYQNDIKLDTLIISTVDTKISLIKIEKVDVESKTEFKFIVDITNEKGSNFSFKSVINDAEQLNSLITQTIDALNSYPEFVKYTDDLTECLK